MELTFDERRVAGVMIEKGFTTPEQYPLTINALVTGSNQKSCRLPVIQIDEERVFLALDGLRKKGLSILVQMQTSRTDRFKHRFADTLGLEDRDVAVLGELLLRGPQTDGELRAHGSRMVTLESLETVEAILAKLLSRDPPLVVRLSPEGRKRGVKYAHRFYSQDELEEIIESEKNAPAEPVQAGPAPASPASALRQELEELRNEVADLRRRVKQLEDSLGGV